MTQRVAAPWKAAACVLAVAFAGCSSLDQGSGPSRLRLATQAGDPGPIELVECGTSQLSAIGLWDGDDPYEADVSASAEWESSNPATVEVFSGGVYSAGTLLAHGPGTATIRARYQGFSAAMTVTIAPIVEQRVMPELTHLAAGSVETFRFEARLVRGGPWITVQPEWSIPQAQAPAVVDGVTGKLQALTGPEDVPFVLEAGLPGCGVSATRELRVGAVDHLEIEYEQPPAQALPVGLAAFMRVLAFFEDPSASPQNLSGQMQIDLENSDKDAIQYDVAAEGIVLKGVAGGGTGQLNLRYAPLGLSVVTERYAFSELEQLDLRLDPVNLALQYPDEVQLQAFGTFDDGLDRVVTREVDWTVSDTAVAIVTSGVFDAGRLIIARDTDQDITVEAFVLIDGRLASAEASVRIVRAD